jgi:hypothetical protein
LLAALPAAELRRLTPHLELFPLRLGEALYRPGEQLQHAHFPTTAIVSLRGVYAHALIVQIGQTAGCNRYHSIEQQLCRWLLSTLDRQPSQEIVMTHELVAGILGVRRESVTAAAGKLQRAGVLSYRRGQITVAGRTGLEAAACECYAVVKEEYRRLRNISPDFAF